MPDSRQSVSITSQEKLDELVAHIRTCGRFALDTEFVSEDSFDPELGLIQVATRERLATVDPLAVPNLSPFWQAVLDGSIEVVMHAAGEDLRICKLKTGMLPGRVVDVQVAAGLVGMSFPSSLGTLTQQFLNTMLGSRETRTDWLRRPLTPAQVRYALDDVRHLLELADLLQSRLDQAGRSAWAEAEYQALLRGIEARDEVDRWRRLPGLIQLNRRGLEAARRLWEWRRDTAKRSNQPTRRAMRDDLLVSIAKRMPTHRADLEALRDFQRPQLAHRSAEIVRLLAEVRAVPDDQLPHRTERVDENRGHAMVVNVLTAVLHRCCAGQGLSPGLVGTAADLRDLIRWHMAGQPDQDLPSLCSGWRREACGELLLDVLSGQRSLRILDLEDAVPLAIDPVADSAP